jgi:hypothetical protein
VILDEAEKITADLLKRFFGLDETVVVGDLYQLNWGGGIAYSKDSGVGPRMGFGR